MLGFQWFFHDGNDLNVFDIHNSNEVAEGEGSNDLDSLNANGP